MKKLIAILLCGVSIASFASARTVAAPSQAARQEATLAQVQPKLLEQKFLVATTVKSAKSAALTVSRAQAIAKVSTTLFA